MAKKRKRNKTKKELGLKEETIHTIAAITLLAIGLLFILAPLNLAGLVGNKIFDWLSTFFGIGYFLFPILALLVAYALMRAVEIAFNGLRMWSSVVFFLAGLAIIQISLLEGGIVGKFLSAPLIQLFDVYASLAILWALVLISLIAIFDEKPSLESFSIINWFRGRREANEQESFEDISVQMPPEQDNEELGEESTQEESVNEDDEATVAEDESKKDASGFGDLFRGKSKAAYSGNGDYAAPPLSLLERRSGRPDVGDIKANANIIKRTLANFGINVEMDEVSIGPSITRYALKPAEGVKLSKILALQNNLEYALASHPVRIEAPIPGKSLVGVEVPNTAKTTVGIASILSSKEFVEAKSPLSVALGRGISGMTYIASISKMPHLLIAGATGSGKSVTIHAVVSSLLYRHSPDELKLIMVDPKRVELTLYNGIPHLLTPVITDAKKAILALKWAAQEMERRYDILEEHKVRDISSYQQNVIKDRKGAPEDEDTPPAMPFIVIIIDELADIMQAYPRELESAIVRLAQMSRAVGIHLILSTQRPSVNVITGLIKANVPTRVALQVASQVDSRTILDSSGAEKLLGAGDMLYLSAEMSKPVRIQSAFISEDEVKKVVNYLKKNYEEDLSDEVVMSDDSSSPNEFFESIGDSEEDDLYEEARQTVVEAGKASTSYLQRKLRVGYARAARLMDILEENGVVGPQDGSKPRDVLIESPTEDYGDPSGPNDDEEQDS
jgi:S-DNA-T family DNA segregation ATPase FtsK/SpoIIIE